MVAAGGRCWQRRCSRTRNWNVCGASRRSAGTSCSGSLPLTPADAFVDPGRGRGPADRLAGRSTVHGAVARFVPEKVSSAPPVAVAGLADQLGVDPAELRSYGRRTKTRTEHVRLAARYLGWRLPTTLELKELDEFLLARALEHDSPTLLFRLGCAAQPLHQPRADPDGRRLRDLLGRADLDQRVVRAGRDAARGKPIDHRLPP